MVTAKAGKISFGFPLKIEDFENGTARPVGDYKLDTALTLRPEFVFRKRKRYFRIGIVNVSLNQQPLCVNEILFIYDSFLHGP